jgi:hypothetical protein
MSKYKRKQSNIISSLKRRNLDLRNELSDYCLNNPVSELERQNVWSYNKSIYECANLSLYKQSKETNVIDFLNAHTCKKKCCAVCNFLIHKSLRRKYKLWFDKNEQICEIVNKKNGAIKYVTEQRFNDVHAETYELRDKKLYDLMHLTLTVPHTKDGFAGEQYYFEKLTRLFWKLRNKSKFWTHWVYGGEYGIEVTGGKWIEKAEAIRRGFAFGHERITSKGKTIVMKKHDDGLHIHLHALLIVRKAIRSRNKLHREILLEWNKLTVSDTAKRKTLTAEMKASIKKGNPEMLTDEDINGMYPTGATFISLETVFRIERDKDGNIEKIRDFKDGKTMIQAIMETISYHFEPLALMKDDNKIDVPLLVELLPHTFGLRMYSKFDCLYGEKSLNIRENALIEDYGEVVELLVDEDTGELSPENEYFICNPALIYHKKNDTDDKDTDVILSHKAKQTMRVLAAHTTGEAVKEMSLIVKAMLKDKKHN